MKHLKIIFALFFFALITSCSSDDGEATEEVPTGGSNNSNTVFVVGSEEINSKVVPLLWIDGVKTTLSSEAGYNTEALAVYVENNDVYIVGKEKKEKESLVLWKNGVRSRVSDLVEFVSFKELVVDNGNVYILGLEDVEFIQNDPATIKYWKNGVGVNIIKSASTKKVNQAEKMVVSNNDVYLSGWEHDDTSGKFTAKFWKNGIATTLSNSTQNSFGSSIVVEGTSVSVLFSEINSSTLREEVKLWKDNVISLIATSSGNIRTEQMIIKDNVRHIVMNENFGKLIYMKDNVRTEITPEGVSNDFLKMQVDGTNVCIAYNDNAIGRYWINGVTKTLTGLENVKSKNMFLSNADVYSLVRGFAKTLFLKNATPSPLPFDQNTLPVTEGIFVKK